MTQLGACSDLRRLGDVVFTLKRVAWETPVGWSPSGRYLVVEDISRRAATERLERSCSALNVWDVNEKAIVCRLEGSSGNLFRSIAWSPDESTIVSASQAFHIDKYGLPRSCTNLTWWSATNGNRLQTHDVDGIPSGTIGRIRWSNQSNRLSIGSHGGILLVDAFTGSRLRRIAPKDMFHAHAWSPDGKYLFASGARLLRCFDPKTGRARWSVRCKEFVLLALDVSSDGEMVASGAGHQIRIANAQTGKRPVFVSAEPYRRQDEMLSQLGVASFSANADYLAAFSSQQGYIWHVDSRCRVATFPASVGSRGFARNGGLFLHVDEDYINVWDLAEGLSGRGDARGS